MLSDERQRCSVQLTSGKPQQLSKLVFKADIFPAQASVRSISAIHQAVGYVMSAGSAQCIERQLAASMPSSQSMSSSIALCNEFLVTDCQYLPQRPFRRRVEAAGSSYLLFWLPLQSRNASRDIPSTPRHTLVGAVQVGMCLQAHQVHLDWFHRVRAPSFLAWNGKT
jgi:hypothetical protein